MPYHRRFSPVGPLPAMDLKRSLLIRITLFALVIFLAAVGVMYYFFVHRHMKAAKK